MTGLILGFVELLRELGWRNLWKAVAGNPPCWMQFYPVARQFSSIAGVESTPPPGRQTK
jgi:hypothetical protein